ncbi:MAG: acyl-CoA thioesterase [Clostridiales bacterium]|nr:acyl-CoA thioesterase [Clostridiales bacterium]
MEIIINSENEMCGTHTYEHVVQYYETDAMQIVHHSNYIRWMEEVRLDFLAKVGLAYDDMEAHGVIIPVLSASCEYRQATRYGETVKIMAKIERFDGLRFFVSYRIVGEDGTLRATGNTSHCFLNKDMKPVNVRKAAPPIYEYFKKFK